MANLFRCTGGGGTPELTHIITKTAYTIPDNETYLIVAVGVTGGIAGHESQSAYCTISYSGSASITALSHYNSFVRKNYNLEGNCGAGANAVYVGVLSNQTGKTVRFSTGGGISSWGMPNGYNMIVFKLE